MIIKKKINSNKIVNILLLLSVLLFLYIFFNNIIKKKSIDLIGSNIDINVIYDINNKHININSNDNIKILLFIDKQNCNTCLINVLYLDEYYNINGRDKEIFVILKDSIGTEFLQFYDSNKLKVPLYRAPFVDENLLKIHFPAIIILKKNTIKEIIYDMNKNENYQKFRKNYSTIK